MRARARLRCRVRVRVSRVRSLRARGGARRRQRREDLRLLLPKNRVVSESAANSRRSHTRRGRAIAAVDDATGIPERNLRKDMSAKEYADLKATLFKTTAAYGAGLTAYSTLGYGLANGFSAALGSGAGLVYLYLLGKYVDELEPNDGEFDDLYTRNLVYEPVNDVFGMLGGAFGKVGQVYSQALLQKRLLVAGPRRRGHLA